MLVGVALSRMWDRYEAAAWWRSSCSSHDWATRCDLEGGDAASVQHDKPATMSGAKGTRVLSKRGDRVLGHDVWVDGVGFFVGDVKVVAPDQSHAQHNLGHGSACLLTRTILARL
jgi:hypothetical protein